jgi:hypothetical protein
MVTCVGRTSMSSIDRIGFGFLGAALAGVALFCTGDEAFSGTAVLRAGGGGGDVRMGMVGLLSTAEAMASALRKGVDAGACRYVGLLCKNGEPSQRA